ncbi:MAG: hypothetical protein F6K35_46890 [Okeania sp. SIO2H7]|nr:hypothetical protein [Okeania sp. SIO2H7]
MPLLQLPDGWYSGHLTLRQRLAPLIVIEFLFPGEEYSLLSKPNQQQPVVGVQTVKKIYQSVPRVRNYAIFNPTTNEIHGFRLGGDRFQRKELTDGRLLIENAELILGTWFGSFRGMERTWLRWMNLDGEVIWMPEEEEEEDR